MGRDSCYAAELHSVTSSGENVERSLWQTDATVTSFLGGLAEEAGSISNPLSECIASVDMLAESLDWSVEQP